MGKVKTFSLGVIIIILASVIGIGFAELMVGPTDWYLGMFPGHWKYTLPISAFLLFIFVLVLIRLFDRKPRRANGKTISSQNA